MIKIGVGCIVTALPTVSQSPQFKCAMTFKYGKLVVKMSSVLFIGKDAVPQQRLIEYLVCLMTLFDYYHIWPLVKYL